MSTHWLDQKIIVQQAAHHAAGITPAMFAAAAAYTEQDEIVDTIVANTIDVPACFVTKHVWARIGQKLVCRKCGWRP